METRPGDVRESLYARITRIFSVLQCMEQVLAYLYLREMAQSQFEIGEITLQAANRSLVSGHYRVMGALQAIQRSLEIGKTCLDILFPEYKP